MHMSRKSSIAGLAMAAGGVLAAILISAWVVGPGFRSGVSWLMLTLGIVLSGISLAALAGKKWTSPVRPVSRRDFPQGPVGRPWANKVVSPSGLQSDRVGEAALINHEIRNHLCTLKGSARLLRQRISGNDYADIIDRIDHVVERLESFAADAEKSESLTGAKGERIRMEDAARNAVKTHFSQSSAQFTWNVPAYPGPALVDAALMEPVFLNLYLNAIEAGALNVATSVRACEDRVVVSVEDDGCGCPAAELDRIFEPFFSTKEGPTRRGLGMVIVRSIVENLRGTIKVRSKNHLGRGRHGLVFQLEFPVMPGEAAHGHSPSEKGSGGNPPPVEPRSRNWLLTLPEPI